MEKTTIIKKIQELKDFIAEFQNSLDSKSELEKTLGVDINFHVGQKVYIWKDKESSWYDVPVQIDKLENAFEKEEITQIILSERENSHTSGCGCGTEEEKKEIIVTYNLDWFSNNIFIEEELWITKEEAIKKNRKEWDIQKKKYNKEQEKEKRDEKERLKRKLKELNN